MCVKGLAFFLMFITNTKTVRDHLEQSFLNYLSARKAIFFSGSKGPVYSNKQLSFV